MNHANKIFDDYPTVDYGIHGAKGCAHCCERAGRTVEQMEGNIMKHEQGCEYRAEQLSKLVRRGQAYERKEIYYPAKVLAFVVDGKRDEHSIQEYDGDSMKMWSQRYHVFRNSCECVTCGLVGVFFAKERSIDRHGKPTSAGYHFNLYGINADGEEVLMTKDHIIPKAKGGKNILSNYQTMCTDCNREKADKL